ncbi:MAG: tRNA uridine-5-carboxymethylaminomethyl(34) synthesis GTPase MnmE [Oscillospiraceae bacterium]|jgi:tRNA modification GTPase|nr:tRNA uridine-5-carboxymethylaminomethyl(34) synthesis GTPase MnmE [Oscillospiraceae bacterium]
MTTTIAALATPPVSGALGIIRISGPDAVALAQTVFFPSGGAPLDRRGSHRAVLGRISIDGRVIDEGFCVLMRAPKSYTGEDVAELQMHGSLLVLNAVLSALWKNGAAPARAGEFTRRAFLNGKLNLSQAEAVRDLIAAQTLDAAYNAAGQISGVIEKRYARLYDTLSGLLAHFQACADYPEEDLPPSAAEETLETLAGIIAELQALLQSYEKGRAQTEGIRCAIIGKPNVGKSTLLNALTGMDRAIVSPEPGTTRDTIEEAVLLGGVLLRLTDCAGLRETDDPIENKGVERARLAAERAALLFVVLDASKPLDGEDRAALDYASERPAVVVLNKSDLPRAVETEMLEAAFLHVCPVSALTGAGIDHIESTVRRIFDSRMIYDGSVLAGARQAEAVRATLDASREAEDALRRGVTPDAVMAELERAMNALDELTGKRMSEDMLDKIFADFCVGK